MSALGQPEVLKPILLRSTTPGPNEKVLKYLEGMSREGEEPDDSPPRSMIDGEEYRSRVSAARTRSATLHSPAPLPKSPLIYTNGHHDEGDDDADSNVQDGVRSEMGETLILPMREPGPHDPPGPKYESYDSGPSFGNFGPLPSEDMPVRTNGHTPAWSATKVPLPDSELAMSPRGTNFDHPALPRAGSRAGKEAERPFSPMSARTKGTAYPPLPESRFGDDESHFPGSPRAKSYARSKAPSISPSDSPSQFKPPPTVVSRKTTAKSVVDPPEQTPKSGSRLQLFNGNGRSQAPASVMSGSHQSRPFSPYRHAPTNEDLLHAAIRGRSIAIPEESERASSVAPSKSHVSKSHVSKTPTQISKVPSEASKAPTQLSKPPTHISKSPSQSSSKAPSQISKAPSQTQTNGKAPSTRASQKAPSVMSSRVSQPPAPPSVGPEDRDGDATPRPHEHHEFELDEQEDQIIREALAGRTPRTSYYAETLEPEVAQHYHDMELCVLLHQEQDVSVHDFVKKALRKAIRQRVKKLGMKYESIDQYRKSYHDHDPRVHLGPEYSSEEPPQWAADIKRELVLMQQRIESLGPKIEELRGPGRSMNDSCFADPDDGDESTRTPMTQTVNIQTQPADSMYIGAQSEVFVDDAGHHHHHHHHDDDDFDETQGGETRTVNGAHYAKSEPRDDSGGQQYLEEELYKLRQRPPGSRSGSHATWEVAREQDMDEFDDEEGDGAPSGLPTIPDGDADRSASPPLPALPDDGEGDRDRGSSTPQPGQWGVVGYSGTSTNGDMSSFTPWQRIHQRLLSWAVIWPMSELDAGLNSTTRGQQVDEIALSIWATQTYKRYVRARLTDKPTGVVDRLFVPPNMADAISNAVFNGQHGNACGMLRDLWAPFGLPGMPRLLVVLAKHRSEADHWVVHRYSLPEGTLVTYDSYAGRTLMDGRPLGWWFAIRIAWPNANYPPPDQLEQKMVRLHRPLQLPIDNAVAAAGIWRNILMGSKGERSLDLERLRDLINTEVKNLRQRKLLGRLSVGPTRQPWEHMS